MQIDSVSQFDFNTIVIFDKLQSFIIFVAKNEQTNNYLHLRNI